MAKKAKKACKTSENLVVGSKVKAYLKGKLTQQVKQLFETFFKDLKLN